MLDFLFFVFGFFAHNFVATKNVLLFGTIVRHSPACCAIQLNPSTALFAAVVLVVGNNARM